MIGLLVCLGPVAVAVPACALVRARLLVALERERRLTLVQVLAAAGSGEPRRGTGARR
ncbi:MAG TPA: hypothetical protein VHJ17_16650 [Thermomonospora sp.]|nr:hypothetical protein [Thermomonospora sp.]